MMDGQLELFPAESASDRRKRAYRKQAEAKLRKQLGEFIRRFGPVTDREISEVLDVDIKLVRARRAQMERSGALVQDGWRIIGGKAQRLWKMRA